MARAQAFAKMEKQPKFAVRYKNRCQNCGRSRSFYRKFKLCRICLRMLSLAGEVPGVTKSSW
jgi:small subunit ribosomal protein S14